MTTATLATPDGPCVGGCGDTTAPDHGGVRMCHTCTTRIITAYLAESRPMNDDQMACQFGAALAHEQSGQPNLALAVALTERTIREAEANPAHAPYVSSMRAFVGGWIRTLGVTR